MFKVKDNFARKTTIMKFLACISVFIIRLCDLRHRWNVSTNEWVPFVDTVYYSSEYISYVVGPKIWDIALPEFKQFKTLNGFQKFNQKIETSKLSLYA